MPYSDDPNLSTPIPFLKYGTLTADNLTVDSLDPGYSYQIINNASADELELGITNAPTRPNMPPPAVPEPSSLALLGLGSLALIGVARRRRSA